MNKVSACLAIALSSGALAVPARVTAADSCAALAGFKLPGHDVIISKAEDLPAAALPPNPYAPPGPAQIMPAHCHVEGVIDRRTGRDGKSYGIGFAVAMPPDWNGRFLFQGGGALNGSVGAPLGAQFAGGKPALERGFAVASTDSGHQGAAFDASFFGDQQAALDFLYQGVAEVTVVGREIVAQRYGKRADHAYFVGCSTGGREAMMMSQRFPDYFDGIVAAAPAMRTSFSNLGLKHVVATLNAIAPKTADGKPDTRGAFSAADRQLVAAKLLEACDPLDGNVDGFIFAPQQCHFDPGVLQCSASKNDACLAAPQVNALREIMAGPRTASGRQVYPGYYYDTGITNARGLPGILVGPMIPEGAPPGGRMDVDAAAANAMDARAMLGDTNAWTNLGSFRGHGGKLIFLHGLSDPWFSAQDTVQYYEQLSRDNPDQPIGDWSRLFLVPGMGHCAGGERTLDQFDLLDAIVGWVEQARAPARVIATGLSAPGESRPLCPYPSHAQYRGRGDARDQANYVCRAPTD